MLNPLRLTSMRFGSTPNRITSASEGSQCCQTGKEKKDETLLESDIPDICNPRAKSRPEKNCVARRAGTRESVNGFSMFVRVAKQAVMSFGIVRAAVMLRLARRRREAVVVGDG